MGQTVITPPTFEPISLEEVRSQLRYDDTTQDGLLAGYILAARQLAEASTHRVFATQTIDCTFDFQWPTVELKQPYAFGFGIYVECRPRLYLPVSPVSAVSSVKYVDGDGAVQTLDPSQYMAILDGPAPYIDPAFNATWPYVRWQPQAITVRVTAGYGSTPGDLPEPIRQAILMLVAHFDANREAVGQDNLVELPYAAEALLSPYRVSRIV